MFVPTPRSSNTTIINKTIVYSDTLLPVKGLGKDLKVSTISDVDEYLLEKCLRIIFESNPNVVFNTIQYSRADKKVYFYTNQEISIKEYEESKFKRYKPITSSSEIVEEIKSILLAEKNNSSDCISLFDIVQLLKKTTYDYERVKKRYQHQFNNIIKNIFGNGGRIIVYDFDYRKKLLKIGFKILSLEFRGSSATYDPLEKDYEEINFAKQNGDLYIVNSKTCYDKEIFAALCSKLSMLYDELISFPDFKNPNYYIPKIIKSVNTSFMIDITARDVGIFVKSQYYINDYDFILFSSIIFNDYLMECNSSIVIESVKNKESEIFKRIFLKIDDCPEWCQATLYEMRQNQLAEEQIIEEEIKQKEAKKQKKLELKRKIFPFLKK